MKLNRYFLVCLAASMTVALFACEDKVRPIRDNGDGDDDSDDDKGLDLDGDGVPDLVVSAQGEVERECESDCKDFPSEPIVEDGAPSDATSLFGDPDDFSPGLCVLEPQLSEGDKPGALFPANWLRPRFKFTGFGDADLFEIRLEADRQKNDLVAYTKETTWYLPKKIWIGMAKSVIDEPIRVTIRAVNSSSPGGPVGASGTFTMAPVVAEGKMVYWATTSSEVMPSTSWLAGFDVGDEDVITALTVLDVGFRDILADSGQNLRPADKGTGEGECQCIGCHVATPDGDAVSFNDHWPWNILIASVEDPTTATVDVGAAPPYLTKGAARLLNMPWVGMQAFSEAYWTPGEKLLVAGYGYPRDPANYSEGDVGYTWTIPTRDTLAWYDLQTSASFEATSGDIARERNILINNELGSSFGIIELQGELLSAASPTWTSDGSTIAYTAATKTQDGRLGENQSTVDIHTVPFNDGAGGQISELEGASEPNHAEYYPTYSPDDRLIVFNREENFRTSKTAVTKFPSPDDRISISGSGMIYYRPHAEVWFVESEGGDPIRLAANDPPSCTGETSPGVINSWGKWSPDVNVSAEYGATRSYYWVVFSSARSYPEQYIVPKTQYSPPDTRSSQLYMGAIVRDEDTGKYTTYPAVYLWNQETHSSNLTPAWDNFKIPPVIVVK